MEHESRRKETGPCEGRECGREEVPQAGTLQADGSYLCRECGGAGAAERTPARHARPVAAALLGEINAAIYARWAALPGDQVACDARIVALGEERASAVALLEGGACAPDLTESEASAARARCGLTPPTPAVPAAVATATGAPESSAGAPVSPGRLGVERVVAPRVSDTGRCDRCGRKALLGGVCVECGDAESADFARECARAYRTTTAATARAAGSKPPDPTKAEVEIHERRVTLYLVAGADGRERWISEPVEPEPQGRAGWVGTAYRIALADREGRAVALGTVAARHPNHAASRARRLGARMA